MYKISAYCCCRVKLFTFAGMKISARMISAIFSPLLFPLFGTILIITANPNLFGYFGLKVHFVWLIIVFALTVMFPLIWLFMMRRLEMIDNLNFEDSKERIIPFIAIATFYLWAAWMFKPNVNMKIPSNQLVFFMMLGCCLSVFVAFFINIFGNISLHTIGAGSLLGLLLPMVRISTYDLRMVLIAGILIAGIIGTARMVLKDHSPREIFSGYLVGFVGQFIAFTILPKIF